METGVGKAFAKETEEVGGGSSSKETERANYTVANTETMQTVV